MSEMKLIMESWRGYLTEAEEPTLADFIEAMAKYDTKGKGKGRLRKILGIGAKAMTAIAMGHFSGVAAAGVGVAAAAGLGANLTGALSDEAIGQIMEKIALKSPNIIKKMFNAVSRNVPDDQRAPIDRYFDLDDETAALIKGGEKTSKLFQKFASELADHHMKKFQELDDVETGEQASRMPLKQWLGGTAEELLRKWMYEGKLGPELTGITITKQEA